MTNVLRRENIVDFGALAEHTLRYVMSLRNMGAKSVEELLGYLIGLAIRSPVPEMTATESRADSSRIARRRERRRQGAAETLTLSSQLLEDLEVLSHWNVARGAASVSLFGSASPAAEAPDYVVSAAIRLSGLTAYDWVQANSSFESLASLLTAHLRDLSDKELEILTRRIATNKADTLEQVGLDFGVTRERIRQLEAKLKPVLQSWIDPSTALGMRAMALRERIRPVSHIDDVLHDVPSAAGSLLHSELSAWLFLDKIDDDFESEDVWLATPSIQSAKSETTVIFDQVAGPNGSAARDVVRETIGEWSQLTDNRLTEWLEHVGLYRVGAGWANLKSRSVPNFAAAYLEHEGERRSLEQVDAAITWPHSILTLRNALLEDSRFTSVARGEWELASWGGKEYSGIKNAISEALADNGGLVSVQSLIDDLVPRFKVTETSVRAYAAAWPFASEKGIVRLASERKSVRPKPPGLTRNLYAAPGQTRLRIRVTSEHLRGSGSPIAIGAAAALGMTPGEKKTFVGDLGLVTVSWDNQPLMSSIRQILVSLDAAVDDLVFLSVAGDTVTAWTVEPNSDPLIALAETVGSRPTERLDADQLRSKIAQSLELGPDATWHDIEARSAARNEPELADALTAALAVIRDE
ncbi:sigma factor-like helix-turn-helix DNA-binding protein [Subtercola boreus]|uniref:sigma factor-like helix-turn-helix DNA-binding protein n=1 Tax=Subtercola boreus TaxID=120213 RepID=UPI0015586647|nr:sigma factor-like helix-turn-helix DNA-binding protein [Subtercola boreus]